MKHVLHAKATEKSTVGGAIFKSIIFGYVDSKKGK